MITWKAFVLALIMQESGGNDRAIGDGGASHGLLQIQEDCLIDANKWRKAMGLSQFKFPNDCYDRQKAEHILFAYLQQYTQARCKEKHTLVSQLKEGEYYWRTGKPPTWEDYARIWNGGPNGYKKQATLKYWGKLKKALEE
tara:strand:- start:1573 stop:1995 length:423 start_codon:yes stop_codon:yes gene_type:complete